jgi:hypothetical protein
VTLDIKCTIDPLTKRIKELSIRASTFSDEKILEFLAAGFGSPKTDYTIVTEGHTYMFQTENGHSY